MLLLPDVYECLCFRVIEGGESIGLVEIKRIMRIAEESQSTFRTILSTKNNCQSGCGEGRSSTKEI